MKTKGPSIPEFALGGEGTKAEGGIRKHGRHRPEVQFRE